MPDFHQEVRRVWRDFWSPLFEELGLTSDAVNGIPEEVRRELHDYHNIMREASWVYSHVTGGRVSKPQTLAFEVTREADDFQAEFFKESISEFLELLHEERQDAMLHGEDVAVDDVVRDLRQWVGLA